MTAVIVSGAAESKRRAGLRLCALALLLWSVPAWAWVAINPALKAPIEPSLSEVSSYALIEADTEVVLAAHNPDQVLPSASLSKLMTSYLVAEALRDGRISLEQQVRISVNAWGTAGSRMFLEHRHVVSVDQLLRGLIVQSGNDAAIALAELVAGNEQSFALLMNSTAQRLGLSSSSYVNSTGLDTVDGTNSMSALDVVLLLKSLISSFPQFYQRYYSEVSYTYNGITQYNRNRLLWSEENLFAVDGGKTGYTEAAGYSLAASGFTDSMRLIAVVMGSSSESQRTDDVKTLLLHGFNFYEKRLLFSEQSQWQPVRIWQGERDFIQVGLRSPLQVIFPRGQFAQLSARLQMNSDYTLAPVANGQPLGYIQVSYNDRPVTRHPLYADERVGAGNFFKQWQDRIKIWLMQKKLI